MMKPSFDKTLVCMDVDFYLAFDTGKKATRKDKDTESHFHITELGLVA